MNRIYRLVFNRARGAIQVTSELGQVRGKHNGGRRRAGAARNCVLAAAAPIAVALALSMATPLLLAVPLHAWADGGDGGGTGGGVGGALGEDGGDAALGSNAGGGGGGAGGTQGGAGGGVGGLGGVGGDGGAHEYEGDVTVLPVADLTGGDGLDGGAGSFGGSGGGGGAGGFGALLTGPGTAEVGTAQAITGGDGGRGGFSNSGSGGDGGDGGVGVRITDGDLGNAGTIAGGDGGGVSFGDDGDGGNGGIGAQLDSGNLTNEGAITGGNGGRSDFGGDGGDGGIGVDLTGGNLTNEDTIAGGNGAGGNDGGDGGFGVRLDNANLTNNGTINAGAGRGGSSLGTGGTAGIGVQLTGGGTIFNTGTITGGFGDDGGGGASSNGTPGAGVTGADLTVINSGTIEGGQSSGSGPRADAITFTGGTNRLELRAGSTISGDVVADGDDTFALGGDTDASLEVSGIGAGAQYQGFEAFEKTGASTWTLTGTTIAATPWTIAEGTLSVSQDANLGASGGLSFDGGALRNTGSITTARDIMLETGGGTFEAQTNLTVNGTISGAGALTKTGTGTLTLTGANSYSGGTTINAGTLQGDTDSLQGTISNNATLVFDQALYGTYAGMLSGNGSVQFTGGVVELTGDSSGFAGASTVENSTLVVNQTLGGSLDIDQGGVLQGAGTVGDTTIAAGGTIAPGNSVGTLQVDGDITFAEGSRYEVEVDPSGTDSDLVAATGTATLEGGSVVHVGADGSYDPSSTYTIITADGGVDGTFDSVSSEFAFLDPSLGYGANDVTLTLQRNEVDFVDAARTRNQRAVATAVDSLTVGNAVFDSVVQLDEATARRSFDELAGEIHASTQTALIQDSRYVREAMLGNLGRALAAESGMATAEAGDRKTTGDAGDSATWIQAIGAFSDSDGDGNAADLERNTRGFLIGGDARIAGHWRAGVTAGYTRTDFDVDARNASGDSENYHVGVYGGTRQGPVALRLGAAYSWHDINTSRSVAFTGFQDGPQAQYDANTAQVFGEVGYDIDLGAMHLEPFVGATYVNVDSDGFTETGGPAALTVQGADTDVTFTTVGLRASRTFEAGGMNAALYGSAGWRHAYDDITPTATNALAGGPDFTVAGVPIAEDSAFVDVGMGVDISDNARLGMSYSGLYGSDVRDHGGRLDLRVRF